MNGDKRSAFELATRYEYGDGIAQNVRFAAKYYRLAAESGLVDAQLVMAKLCLIGKGVHQDVEEAAHWYLLAAEQGDSTAQFNLAEMYSHGRGVEQDAQKAEWWFRQAQQQTATQELNHVATSTPDWDADDTRRNCTE